MGVVWAAVNLRTGREVAVKLITSAAEQLKLRERLLREARAIGQLRHRNIVEVLDAGETDDGEPYFVMPLFIGETLRQLLDRRRRLDWPVVAQIGRDIARALSAAHEANIVHRDLKPANIFLHREPGSDGVVIKVVDFGVCKLLETEDSTITAPNNVIGTIPYMSPEQFQPSLGIDPRSDIWALGVVMFELLTGRKPFQGEQVDMVLNIVSSKVEIPQVSRFVRGVPQGLVDIVARCMVRDRNLRIGSAAELSDMLQHFVGSSEGLRVYGPPIARSPQSSRPDIDSAAQASRAGEEADPGSLAVSVMDLTAAEGRRRTPSSAVPSMPWSRDGAAARASDFGVVLIDDAPGFPKDISDDAPTVPRTIRRIGTPPPPPANICGPRHYSGAEFNSASADAGGVPGAQALEGEAPSTRDRHALNQIPVLADSASISPENGKIMSHVANLRARLSRKVRPKLVTVSVGAAVLSMAFMGITLFSHCAPAATPIAKPVLSPVLPVLIAPLKKASVSPVSNGSVVSAATVTPEEATNVVEASKAAAPPKAVVPPKPPSPTANRTVPIPTTRPKPTAPPGRVQAPPIKKPAKSSVRSLQSGKPQGCSKAVKMACKSGV